MQFLLGPGFLAFFHGPRFGDTCSTLMLSSVVFGAASEFEAKWQPTDQPSLKPAQGDHSMAEAYCNVCSWDYLCIRSPVLCWGMSGVQGPENFISVALGMGLILIPLWYCTLVLRILYEVAWRSLEAELFCLLLCSLFAVPFPLDSAELF